MDKNKVGLIVGAFLGLWHLTWSILVAVGLAQVLLDFIYSIHFLNNPFTVAQFSITKAAILVVVTAIIGYVVGYVFAAIWGLVQKRK